MKGTSDKYGFVYVRWVDSFGVHADWREVSDYSPVPIHYCYSVGWIIGEDKNSIILAPHLSPENKEIGAVEQVCGDMVIPKCSIKKMTVLKLGDEIIPDGNDDED